MAKDDIPWSFPHTTHKHSNATACKLIYRAYVCVCRCVFNKVAANARNSGSKSKRQKYAERRDGPGEHMPQAFVPTANFQVFPHDGVGFGGGGDFDAKALGSTVLVQQTLFDIAVLVFVDIVFLKRERTECMEITDVDSSG